MTFWFMCPQMLLPPTIFVLASIAKFTENHDCPILPLGYETLTTVQTHFSKSIEKLVQINDCERSPVLFIGQTSSIYQPCFV